MFNDAQKAAFAAILANYGAERCAIDRDGKVFAIVGSQEFQVKGLVFEFGPDPESIAEAKALEAIIKAGSK